MKKKIILHGHLRDKYPHDISVEAETIGEALRALKYIPELDHPPGQPWPVQVKDVNSEIALFSPSSMEEIHVYPRMGGAGGKGGLGQIILGVILITLAFMNPAGIGFLTQNMLFSSGAMMLLGGVLQLLAPTPEAPAEEEKSRYLGARGNTVQIGTRIAVGYGNNKIPGQYLSFDVDAVEYAGDDAGSGASTIVEDNVFMEYDKTPSALAPVNPIYASATPSPTNIPTAGWTS